ncbi:hypothetical protein LV779_11715 [Streptomyces thinghirensis]|nr:hypothetical protein [Streptomyces thinghirensis]
MLRLPEADPVRPQARADDHLHRGPHLLPPQRGAHRPPECRGPAAHPARRGSRRTATAPPSTASEHVALVHGDIGDGKDVLVRIHSECLTGDVFGSQRCDCGPQLDASLDRIQAEGRGVVVTCAATRGAASA